MTLVCFLQLKTKKKNNNNEKKKKKAMATSLCRLVARLGIQLSL